MSNEDQVKGELARPLDELKESPGVGAGRDASATGWDREEEAMRLRLSVMRALGLVTDLAEVWDSSQADNLFERVDAVGRTVDPTWADRKPLSGWEATLRGDRGHFAIAFEQILIFADAAGVVGQVKAQLRQGPLPSPDADRDATLNALMVSEQALQRALVLVARRLDEIGAVLYQLPEGS